MMWRVECETQNQPGKSRKNAKKLTNYEEFAVSERIEPDN